MYVILYSIYLTLYQSSSYQGHRRVRCQTGPGGVHPTSGASAGLLRKLESGKTHITMCIYVYYIKVCKSELMFNMCICRRLWCL